MPLGVGEVLISMEQRLQLGAVVLLANEGVGPEDCFETLERIARLAPECPVSSAICDIVTARSPCRETSAAVVSRIASPTSRRCAAMVSLQSLGTHPSYILTSINTLCIDEDRVYRSL